MGKWWNVDDYGVLTIDADTYIKENGSGVLPTASKQLWLVIYEKEDITKIEFIGKGLSFPENSSCFFKWYENVTEIEGLELVSTKNVTNMNCMFHGMYSLTELNLSNFDTRNVTKMNGMFTLCKSLKKLDLSSFDTSNVTRMSYMFYNMRSLIELDVSSFDTSSVTKMVYMFAHCEKIAELDVSSFDTSKVTDMSGMFRQTSAKVKLWDM